MDRFRRNGMNQKSILRSGGRVKTDYDLPGNVERLPGIAMPAPVSRDDPSKRSFDLQKRHNIGKLDQPFDVVGRLSVVRFSGGGLLPAIGFENAGDELSMWTRKIPSNETFIIQSYQFFAERRSPTLGTDRMFDPSGTIHRLSFHIYINGAQPIFSRYVINNTQEVDGLVLVTKDPDRIPGQGGVSVSVPSSARLEVRVRNLKLDPAVDPDPIGYVGFRLRGFSTPLKMED